MVDATSMSSLINAMIMSIDEDAAIEGASLQNQPVIQSAMAAIANKNPETFFYTLTFPMSEAIRGMLITQFNNNSSVNFIFERYDFLKNHLCALFSQFEGRGCSADKARTVISSLINFYLSGEEIKWNFNQEYTYGLPKVIMQDHQSVVSYFEAIRNLYYGQSSDYFKWMAKAFSDFKNMSELNS